MLDKLKNIFSGVTREKVLFYPGCMTEHNLKHILDKYKSLLSDLGINYVTSKEMVCCGSPLLNAGYKDDFEDTKKKNISILKKNKITNIITGCPHCYDMFKDEYGFAVNHVSEILSKNKHKISLINSGEISYHDPCILAKKHKICNPPREALRASGFKIVESVRCKEKTFCCGAGGGLKQNSPKIANKIAKERLLQFRTKKIIVSCPYCYSHLKENSKGKEIFDLGEILIDE